jgi:protein TonB
MPGYVKIDRPKGIFQETLLVSGLIHLVCLFLIITFSQAKPGPVFKPLAVMDFSQYDPLGGSPGGLTENTEPAAPEPEPEPEQVPEPEPVLVESVSEEATVIPPPAPPEKKIKPKKDREPKPQPQGPPNPNLEAAGTGRGGIGGGQGQGNADLLGAYKSQISLRLNRYKKYPTDAMTRRLNGVAKVSFRVNAQGRVSAARLSASSGYPVLDEEALALLKRCSPFPPIPQGLGLASMELDVPISFSVRR